MIPFTYTQSVKPPPYIVDAIRTMVFHHCKVGAIRLLRSYVEDVNCYTPSLREAKEYCDQFPVGGEL